MSAIIYEYSEVTNLKLKNYIVDTPQLHKYFKLDWNVLKTKQYCGILNFEGQDFYILPKIVDKDDTNNLDTFIYMLMYAYNIKLENEDIASCKNEQSNTILEVFVQLFARNLFNEFKRGIYREYITEQDNLTMLRGKYLVNENLKYNFVNNKIYCEYDDFSMNNTLNQFFLYIVKTLLPFIKNKKILKQCELALDEVELRLFNIKTLHVDFNRLNARYKESYEFGLLLLSKMIPLFSKDKKSFAFLFDMNILFEKFVGRMVQEIDPSTRLQNEKKFGDMILRPDILTDDCIIDTKYKKLNSKEDIKQSDKYQMYAYGKNYDKTNTMLLYPRHLENFEYELKLGGDDKIVLHVKTLDLDREMIDDYNSYLKEIRIKLEQLI